MTQLDELSPYGGTVPSLLNATDEYSYAIEVENYLTWWDVTNTPQLENFRSQLNVLSGEMQQVANDTVVVYNNTVGLRDEVTVMKDTAVAAANYKGDWSDTASYSTGESITYQGLVYVSKVDDNTTEPTFNESTNEWFISRVAFVNVSANADYTAKKYDRILADTANGSFTVTLPPSPSANDVVAIMDIASSFSTNPLSVARNGNTIMGLDANYEASKKASLLNFTYINDTWHVFETFQTEQVAKPIISIATSVNEQSSIDGSITNYDSEVSYFMSVTNGTVKDNKDGTFQYISPDVDEDETDTLTIYGTKAGMLRSENSLVAITVHDVPVESDDAISNANFSDNESYNNGFEY